MEPADLPQRERFDRAVGVVRHAIAIYFFLTILLPSTPIMSRLVGFSVRAFWVGLETLFAGAAVVAAVGVIGIARSLRGHGGATAARGLAAVLLYWALLHVAAIVLMHYAGATGPAVSAAGIVSSPLLVHGSQFLAILTAAVVARHVARRWGGEVVPAFGLRLLVGGALLIAALQAGNRILMILVARSASGGAAPSGTVVMIGGALTLLATVLLLFWNVWTYFELDGLRRRVLFAGGCSECGYPLGGSTRCPECGADLRASAAATAPSA